MVCRGRVFGKPKSLLEAFRMLKSLNGKWHRVYTGVALVDARTRRSWSGVCISRVKARNLPWDHLRNLARKNLDKSGGYSVQNVRDPFVERAVGPWDNVVGLPLELVRKLLKESGAWESLRWNGTTKRSSNRSKLSR